MTNVRRLIAQNASRGNETVWNLFAQLLFPLVMILTFVAVVDISGYRYAVQHVMEKNDHLVDQLGNIADTDSAKAKIAEWRNIYELQRNRLQGAWDRVRRRERARLYLDRFFSADRVMMSGVSIADVAFKRLCETTTESLPIAGSARQTLLERLYAEVLRGAKLTDYRTERGVVPVHQWDPKLTEIEDVPFPELPKDKQNQLALASRRVILPANQAFMHNEVIRGVNDFRSETTRVQRAVLERIFGSLVKAPEQLKPEARILLAAVQDRTLAPERRKRKAEEFYSFQNLEVRARLESDGYIFLAETWAPLRSIR